MTSTNPTIPTEGGSDRETVSLWVEENPGNQVTSHEPELVLVMYSSIQKQG